MPTFILRKNGVTVNTIIADSIESTGDYWDEVEEFIPPRPEDVSTPKTPELILPPRVWTHVEIRSKMSFVEKVKWDNNLTPEIITAKYEFSYPRTEEDTQEILNFLVTTNNISEETKNSILL